MQATKRTPFALIKKIQTGISHLDLLSPQVVYKNILGGFYSRLYVKNFEQKARKITPILIYQMGKVSSASILYFLQKHYTGDVAHNHYFSKEHKFHTVRQFYNWVKIQNNPVNVISLVREPIARNISDFFQDFDENTGIPYEQANFSSAELKARFLQNYYHHLPLGWFDRNILYNFGIDVYATPFPDNGIATYEKENVRLLIMRSDLIDTDKLQAMADFLGVSWGGGG